MEKEDNIKKLKMGCTLEIDAWKQVREKTIEILGNFKLGKQFNFTELENQLQKDDAIAEEIKCTFERLERQNFDSSDFDMACKCLQMFGIFREFLTVIKLDESGIRVTIGSNPVEYLIDPYIFIEALQNELELLEYSRKSQLDEQDYNILTLICSTALQREFEKYIIINSYKIELLRTIAFELHGNSKAVGISKAAGGAVGAAGGIIMLVGLILEPLTFGASTTLIIAGAAIAAGGVINIGAGIGDAVRKNYLEKRNPEKTSNDKRLSTTIANLIELVELSTIEAEKISLGRTGYAKQGAAVGKTVVKVALSEAAGGLKIAGRAAIQVLRNVFRFSAAGVGIALDILSILDAGISLVKGGTSEIGYKFAIAAEELETSCEEQQRLIKEVQEKMQHANNDIESL